MMIAALCISFLLFGFSLGLLGYAQAEDRAFRRLLAAQGRSYAVLAEDIQ